MLNLKINRIENFDSVAKTNRKKKMQFPQADVD